MAAQIGAAQGAMPPHTAATTPSAARGTARRSRASEAPTGASEAKTPCRFWGSKNGCRAGNSCQFYHDPNTAASSAPAADKQAGHDPKAEKRRYQAPKVEASKVVSRPAPKKETGNPREFQLQQMRRRFSPAEAQSAAGTTLEIKLSPSDPDFPFEMDALECVLDVPSAFPSGARPTLAVRNKEMGRGYQINVERGFDAIVAEFPTSTLLGWTNILDRRLEQLLTGEKAETVKLVANRGRPAPGPAPAAAAPAQSAPVAPPAPRPRRAPSHSRDQLDGASQLRETQTRQLEARLGRLPLFAKSSDGLFYTLPVEPRRRDQLPVPLQSIKAVRLRVPRLYPLEPCVLELQGVARDAAARTEREFAARAAAASDATLLAQVNYLAQNMHVFATKADEAATPAPAPEPVAESEAAEEQEQPKPLPRSGDEDDRSHIHIIPRPAEWEPGYYDVGKASDSESNFSDYDASDTPSEHDGEDEDEQPADATAAAAAASDSGPERGIALSFPNAVLSNISLLALTSLALTVTCGRCKTAADATVTPASPASLTCTKCSSELSLALRPQLVHTHNARACLIDAGGCAVRDMRPSAFEPTCAPCGEAYRTGLVGARGAAADGVCRGCHARLRLELPEAKFLALSGAGAGLPPRKAKTKGEPGLVGGSPLPKTGLCAHYRHSHRWFRFGCCNKVYACDRCHDAQEGHPYEHGTKMVCGWCSREQRFRQDTCGACGRWVVRRAGRSGFWEGGQGTRERALMRRKDARKFKRTGEEKKQAEKRADKRADKKKAKGE